LRLWPEPQPDGRRPPRLAGVARWVLIGAAPTAVWGLVTHALTRHRRPARAETLDRTARGLGKVFWTKGIEPKLYGAAMLRKAA
ncbi:MAG: hypothetical protein VXZ43_01415, partial [Pseudomonadota bacterium]|nr:hypothetical protein [Pseudomonadota bacterium]